MMYITIYPRKTSTQLRHQTDTKACFKLGEYASMEWQNLLLQGEGKREWLPTYLPEVLYL